jgi:cystathionine beta-lyase family protein involved in aluminum resistance
VVLNDLCTEMKNLDDRELAYVVARSKAFSDRKALNDSGIASSTFYGWDEAKRDYLNEIAMRFKRETATRVLMAFQDNAEKAANTIVKLMDSRNEIIKLKSSQETLDRAIGKVSQSFEVSGKDGGVIVVEFGEPIPPRSDG